MLGVIQPSRVKADMGRAEDLFSRFSDGGADAIDAMIDDRQAEELFLDFKRSADQGTGTKLHQNDRNNLAKAISGFGNSEGGVIVWGVECKNNPQAGDVASAKHPIHNPKRFVSWLEGAISGCTVPPHPGVRHLCVASTSAEDEGYGITLVPTSYLAPHQCVSPPQYYMRAGSDFLPVPHAVLQGMFGRRPQADIFHMWDVRKFQVVPVVGTPRAIAFEAGFLLSTHGPGLVDDMFITAVIGRPGGKSEVTWGFPSPENWHAKQAFGYRFSVVSTTGFKLAPGAILEPFVLDYRLEPPFPGFLHVILQYGHSESSTTVVEHRVSSSELQAAYDQYLTAPSTQAENDFTTVIVGGSDTAPEKA